MKNVIIKQGGGIGDILYSLKIAQKIYKTNNCNIIWPINSHILSDFQDYIKIPYIEWVDEKDYKWLDDYNYFVNGELIPSSLKIDKETVVFPLCEAANNPDGSFKGGPIMGKKYSTFKLSQANWQDSIKITRNVEKENELFYKVLNLDDNCKYVFVHKIYSTPSHGLLKSTFMPDDFLPDWEKDYEALVTGACLEEYSVFDWIKVFENAADIHVVSTCLFYIFESLEKKLPEIKIYNRDHYTNLGQLYCMKPTLRQKWKFQEAMERHYRGNAKSKKASHNKILIEREA
mgnify:CR=1 FL=1|tara:strand:+ start:156 stop:1019 length:864 start_codon:yes stop_codon:yes gene_type:complete